MSTCASQSMTNHHVSGVWGGLGELFQTWRDRYHSRHELARWSERDLHDLGLSRGDVSFEVEKPFWRA
jgi:uncharacterized protein YjiS (DUF1127 family)